ncbi:hypothetical protein K450DRAFT_259123 [Umbelopsis ramanniana AG]|uniref:GCS light chain n=1 Tax=Umbelopsis ramanniana AG TaxID=1314678 RepID=A0AAD5E3S1_UMBRA|nr:uncharacterized protein K450DRAFT_259123 [Umbelopsis ramanniana AG]KAI8575951.1 hypothetical protein K450DRAFT_259123 [Umbelopsis ramanniana AG]
MTVSTTTQHWNGSMPMVPKFDHLVLYTGNVMKTSIAGKNNSLSTKSNLELVAAINDTLRTSFHVSDQPSFHYHEDSGLLEVPDLRLSSIVPVEDRKDVEITAKLFILGSDPSQAAVTQSLNHLHRLLGVSTIENFILSATNDDVLPAWRSLQELHRNKVVERLGVTDFSQSDLKSFSQKVQVQPAVNQIDLAECCQLPRDLITYAKANNIELLAHSDYSDILPKETLNKIMKAQNLVGENATLHPRWVLKYTVFVKCRGVVADKGYIVMADA